MRAKQAYNSHWAQPPNPKKIDKFYPKRRSGFLQFDPKSQGVYTFTQQIHGLYPNKSSVQRLLPQSKRPPTCEINCFQVMGGSMKTSKFPIETILNIISPLNPSATWWTPIEAPWKPKPLVSLSQMSNHLSFRGKFVHLHNNLVHPRNKKGQHQIITFVIN